MGPGGPPTQLDLPDSRRFFAYAVVATALVVGAPALVVVPLAPFEGVADVLVSAALATGLSVCLGSVAALVWASRAQAREIAFADLMLWTWARRVRAERRLARALSGGEARPQDRGGRHDLRSLRAMAVVLDARAAATHGHSGRVAEHAERIARRLRLADRDRERIALAAALHEVGKVRVPTSILAEDGELTADERRLLERHPELGAELVAHAGDDDVAEIVRHHRERYDGEGLPDGLAGAEIPLGARVVAVADAFDRLATGAARGPAASANALDALAAEAGSALDPDVVSAFLDYYSGRRSIATAALTATAPPRALRWILATPSLAGAGGAAPLLKSVCAGGVAALAGVCMAVAPTQQTDRDDAATTGQRTQDASPPPAATASEDRGDPRVRRAGPRLLAVRPAPRGRSSDPAPPAAPDGDADAPAHSPSGGSTPPVPVARTTPPPFAAGVPPVDPPAGAGRALGLVTDPVRGAAGSVVDAAPDLPAPAEPVERAVDALLGDD